jgi:CDP-glycerol glycerophosphotransferase (TagB/SpsB family)
MKLSVVFRLRSDKSENDKTRRSLAEAAGDSGIDLQLILYSENGKTEDYRGYGEGCEIICSDVKDSGIAVCCADAKQYVTGELVTVVDGGDTFSAGAFKVLLSAYEKYPEERAYMFQKVMPDGKNGAFSRDAGKVERIHLKRDYQCYPFYFGGTFVAAEYFKKHDFNTSCGLETERDYFLRLCMSRMLVVLCGTAVYNSSTAREGDKTFFEDIYKPEWYKESFEEYWIPTLQKIKERKNNIPNFLQYHVMFTIYSRFYSNWNNRNKHVIPGGQEPYTFELIGKVLQYIDDDIMLNGNRIKESMCVDSVKWVYGILKNGSDFKFEKYHLFGNVYYGYGNVVLNRVSNLKTNIVFMNYENGMLHIDGTIHPLAYSLAEDIHFTFGGKKYPLEFNERYTLLKVFGQSIYKSHAFHVAIPMDDVKDANLFCFAVIGGEVVKLTFSYESHFSRMSGAFTNSYWYFGDSQMYMAVKFEDGMNFKAVTKRERNKQERKLSKEMLRSRSARALLFLLIRKTVFMMRPIMKRRPIWMYLDKIYKGGDSSEYLYRYAVGKKDGFKHYYLIDKNASDYKRLRKDGFRPLVRGSIKHRLVFLMADMMVISNSTVFAFNNFGLPNSSYVRDIVDFHVCCVQHGMSVQKIAVAQNRLRDNTRLYFCASKYEIENLSRPIYDYIGYDALKLTGVPRYDGLVDDDKKQIMISPTWRMQAAVPVTTSEGEQREYNPLFKESTYFKVFNALVNDPKLIEAAKKYGYRIKYVLHPIVSAQVDDFDKNDYVDIIPAVGDMSYERMFCESSLMVTDFSGIQFDFAYMRKPLVYLHHKDIPQHYEEGTFFYDTMAFGEIAHDNDELIDLLCEYMANGCRMKEEYVKRADDFFYYNDRNNCERIYDTMIQYQKEHILKET